MSDAVGKIGDVPPKPRPALPDNHLVGTSPTASGVVGKSNTGFGVLGQSIGPPGNALISGSDGVRGEGEPGVHGVGTKEGILGEGFTGVHGKGAQVYGT